MITAYYRVRDDLDVPGRWFLKSPLEADGRELDERRFLEGKRVDVVAPLTLPVREAGSALDVTLADSDVPVVRSTVGALIEQLAPGQVQRIPVVIQGVSEPFEILNVTRLADCLDRRQSSITYWQPEDGRPEKVGTPRMITRIKVDSSCVGEANVFRLADWKIAWIVSNRVRQALLAAEVTGIRFLQV